MKQETIIMPIYFSHILKYFNYMIGKLVSFFFAQDFIAFQRSFMYFLKARHELHLSKCPSSRLNSRDSPEMQVEFIV